MTPFEILAVLLLILTSAFVSSSEVAIFSLSRFQLRYLRDHFRVAYRKLRALLADSSGLLITLLICNELANIGLSVIFAQVTTREWQPNNSWLIQLLPQLEAQWPEWLIQTVESVAVATPILMILNELTPKVVGAKLNQLIAPLHSHALFFLFQLFRPVRALIRGAEILVRKLTGSYRGKGHSKDEPIREEEIMVMAEEGAKSGSLQQSELELIRNVFELDDTLVSEIMTPKERAFTLPAHLSIKDAIQQLKLRPFSRVPVIDPKQKNEIVGILYRKDLILDNLPPDTPICDIVRKPFTVEGSLPLHQLFRRMKQQKTHIAVVINNKQRTVGIVTMNDLLQEIFDDALPESR